MAGYDLQARYDHFNRAYFDGELPKIPLKFAALKGKGGIVQYAIVRTGPAPNPRMVRLGYANKYQGFVAKPETIRMTINNAYARTNEAIDGILLHEMIHVYFASKNDVGESHGPKFNAMLKKISRESGVDIPLTDDTEGLELADTVAVKALGVVVITKKDGSLSFYCISAKNAHDQLEAIKKHWESAGRYQKSVVLYSIATMVWTKIAMEYPVARNVIKPSAIYKLLNATAVDDLKENGHELFKLEFAPRV